MWHSIIMPENIRKQFCYYTYYTLGDFESNKPLESNLQHFLNCVDIISKALPVRYFIHV